MNKKWREDILILAKTYPSPSSKYTETSCVAGINSEGMMRRIFPVPFRLLDESSKFEKWHWINATIEKASNDRRPESYKIDAGSIQIGSKIDTKHGWFKRQPWIDKIPQLGGVNELMESGLSLGLVHPKQIIELHISEPSNLSWTHEEIQKLTQAEKQSSLFSDMQEIERKVKRLQKMPINLHYTYTCTSPLGKEEEYKHKIVDWEIGGLLFKCKKDYGKDWLPALKYKLEKELPSKELMFLMGNIHRFQNQWLIISLIYPPKQQPVANPAQMLLL